MITYLLFASENMFAKSTLKNLGIPESELLEGVEVVALPTIAEQMMDRETLMC
jgi:hypothetical protein